jgi:hypothetical protein
MPFARTQHDNLINNIKLHNTLSFLSLTAKKP